ncbi:hypothetical protein TESG_03894 [Trichophyton tonsurans CBS 112818]|uniref:Uncharacterized protein n=1 Tax=Trichophyton tonsurans (strain CBS 112818) TaxID=647933 RepID=F2RYQ2_TRIT1|nr:hypothetical protein TESG_03894 [Trichophyton tonsurans CBS 112818]
MARALCETVPDPNRSRLYAFTGYLMENPPPGSLRWDPERTCTEYVVVVVGYRAGGIMGVEQNVKNCVYPYLFFANLKATLRDDPESNDDSTSPVYGVKNQPFASNYPLSS